MSEQPASLLSPRILVPFALVTLIWGSTWIVIKGQLGVVPPSWSVTYRFAIAAIAMFAFAALRRVVPTICPNPAGVANVPSFRLATQAP